MVDGYIKLLYPDDSFTKDDVAECLTMALEMRRRVKGQLKKLGGMAFYDVNFSYLDNETFEEHYVYVPEQGEKLLSEGMCNPGQVLYSSISWQSRNDRCVPSRESDVAG